MAVMTAKAVRHLPVLEHKKIVGMFRLAIWSKASLLISSLRSNSLNITSRAAGNPL